MLSGRRGKQPPDIVAEIRPVRAGLKISGMVKFTSPFNSRFGRGGAAQARRHQASDERKFLAARNAEAGLVAGRSKTYNRI